MGSFERSPRLAGTNSINVLCRVEPVSFGAAPTASTK
jgi:hypothetical protein